MKSPTAVFKPLFAFAGLALLLAGCASPNTTQSAVGIGHIAPPVPVPPAFTPQAQANPRPSQAWPVTTTAQPPGPRENPAIVPVIQRGTDGKHQSYVALAQKGDIDLLFMGDSITDFWHTRGKEVWDHYYGNMKAANFGINADRTQNVLWRLQNGEGQGFSPKVVVLMIGTNNTGVLSRSPSAVPSGWRNTNAEAVEGITAIVTELRKDFPNAKILLLSIFPRGDDALAMQQIPEINHAIAKLDDEQHVFYLDVTKNFLGADGQINPDYFQLSDRLHPTPAGYVVWAESMKPMLEKLMK